MVIITSIIIIVAILMLAGMQLFCSLNPRSAWIFLSNRNQYHARTTREMPKFHVHTFRRLKMYIFK